MHQRQNGSALVVILIICLGNRGRGRNRGDFADADGTAGDAKPRLVDDDCLDLGNLMRAEQPQLSVFVDGLAIFVDRLSKECGLSESTIANILKRNATPSIATLEALCAGFGITLSQFFAEGEMIELTPDLKPLIEQWVTLTPSQKQAVLIMVKEMNNLKA